VVSEAFLKNMVSNLIFKKYLDSDQIYLKLFAFVYKVCEQATFFFFFFFYNRDIWGFAWTRSPGHHAKHSLYTNWVKLGLLLAGVTSPKNCLRSRGVKES
jgi:hypothetical protein